MRMPRFVMAAFRVNRFTPPQPYGDYEMPIKTITCPDCGLVLRVARDATKSTLLYEVGDWQSRCQRRELDDPTWCLIIRRDDTRPKKQTN